MRVQEFNVEDDEDDDDGDDNDHVEAFMDAMHVCDTLHVNMDSIRHYIFDSFPIRWCLFLSIDVRVTFMLHEWMCAWAYAFVFVWLDVNPRSLYINFQRSISDISDISDYSDSGLHVICESFKTR